MLGKKFINTQVQVALIKEIIYSYLHNCYVVSPNIFFKGLLTNIDKNNPDSNSKEKYDEFIKQNEFIKDDFYKEIQQSRAIKVPGGINGPKPVTKNIGGKKTLSYMYLTCILNEDIKENVYKLSANEFEEKGKAALDSLFYDSLLEFLDNIKNVTDINNNPNNATSNSSNNFFGSNSLETTISNSTYTETLNNFEENCFIGGQDYGGKYNNNVDVTSQFYNFKYTKNDPEKFNTLLNKNTGLSSEFHYRIKAQIPVELNCGAKAKEHPILISLRNTKSFTDIYEVFCVQKYFDWQNDETYRELEQFIFLRDADTSEILKEDGNLIVRTDKFNDKDYLGIKFLKRDEILKLKDTLLNIPKKNGFIALIPVTKVLDNFIDNFNNIIKGVSSAENNYKIYLSTFSTFEKSIKLSYSDICRLLSVKDEVDDTDWNILTTDPYNFSGANYIKNSKSVIFLKAWPYKNISFNYQYISNFDVNKLFDLYFRMNLLTYEINNIERTFSIKTAKQFTEKDLSKKQILDKEFKNVDKNEIINKTGKFLLLADLNMPFTIDVSLAVGEAAAKNYFVLNQTFNDIEKLTDNKKYKQQYFLQTRQEIFEILLNENTQNVFDKEYVPNFLQLYYNLQSQAAEKPTPINFDIDNLLYIKEKYSELVITKLQGEAFQEFINTFFSPAGENSTTDLTAINIGQIKKDKQGNIDFGDLLGKPKTYDYNGDKITVTLPELRSYKNFLDFINYYVNSVEGLMIGAEDYV